MKKLMKYVVLPRALVLLLAMSLMLVASVLPAAAASEKVYTEWTYDQTNQTLTATFPNGDTRVYHRVEANANLRFDPESTFQYNQTATVDGESYVVYAAEEKGESLALAAGDDTYLFFATEERLAELDELSSDRKAKGASLSYVELDYLRHYDLDSGFLRRISNAQEQKLTETVTDTLYGLRYAPRYEVWLYDEDDFLAVNSGFIFDLAGELYFISLLDLPASALDGEGKLLPSESVTVTLQRLPEDLESAAFRAVSYASSSGGWFYTEYEGGYLGGLLDPNFGLDANVPVGLVYFTIAFLGIVVPIAPLVLGLTLPHSQKQGYSKRWYLLAYLSGAWMLMGVVLLVAMIVAL